MRGQNTEAGKHNGKLIFMWSYPGTLAGQVEANGSLSTGGSQVGDARTQLSGTGKLGVLWEP